MASGKITLRKFTGMPVDLFKPRQRKLQPKDFFIAEIKTFETKSRRVNLCRFLNVCYMNIILVSIRVPETETSFLNRVRAGPELVLKKCTAGHEGRDYTITGFGVYPLDISAAFFFMKRRKSCNFRTEQPS